MDRFERKYDSIFHGQSKVKAKTDWNGMMQDLFGIDTPQAVESNLDSTSSGVVSDLTLHSPTSSSSKTILTATRSSNKCAILGDRSDSEELYQDTGPKMSPWINSPLPKTSTPICVPNQQPYILRHSPVSPLFFRASDTPAPVHPLSSPDIEKEGREQTEIPGGIVPHANLYSWKKLSRNEPKLSYLSTSTARPTFPFDPTYFHNNRGDQTESLHPTPHHTDTQNMVANVNNNKGDFTETLYAKPHRVYPHSFNKIANNESRLKNPYYTHTSPFDDLMDDVTIRIFSNLSTDRLCRCARVCRRWYQLVWDPSLWNSIIINSTTIHVDRALKYLTRRLSYNTPKVCVILERVNLNGCGLLTDKGLHVVARRCPELRYLELQGCCKLTNVGVYEAVSSCVNLERLDLTGCSQVTCIQLQGTAITDTTTTALHLHLIYLHYLDLTDCRGVKDQALRLIAIHCMQLQFLFLRRCFHITDQGITHIANSCYCLRELSVSDCRGITDLSLRELSKLGDNLRYLGVAKCLHISDQGVKYIAKYCQKLRYLNVRGCGGITDLSLQYLSRHCPRLCSLDVGKCDVSDVGLQTLAERCPQLRKLSVKSCQAVTDRGLMVLAYHCSHLTHLHVHHCRVSSQALYTVSRYCNECWVQHTNPAALF